ncbi:hypothetical protein HYT23_06290 [Candidatus Pacearchaeota archaeon]|nr:hypothetical protein [Candidatus Pacearchaeota archaeon]
MSGDIRFEVIKKIAEARFKYKDMSRISMLNSSSPPSVFVGSKLKYPLVNVGILSPLDRDEDAWIYDDMKYWADYNFSIKDVLNLRDNLLNSRFKSSVKEAAKTGRFVQIAQEIAIASRPVDVEIELERDINVGRQKDRILTPMGMTAPLKKARVTGNVKVDERLDKTINDDIKASEGMKYLYKNSFNEYALSKILSVGVLGLKKNKKFVPTRWSITATDDTIGKQLIEEIKNYKWIEDFELFYGSFMGNCYVVMFFPGVWSFELFELYLPGSSWNPSQEIKASTDFESYDGRKEYAFSTQGGYYASRLPVLEYLNRIKRQASVLVIRLETQSYWATLGVWVCRESIRKALANKKITFNDMKEITESARKISMIKYGFDNNQILSRSKLLEQLKTQTNLKKWL